METKEVFYQPKIVLLNTSILTTYGSFKYQPIPLNCVKEILHSQSKPILSAIGHQATADIIKTLTEFDCPVNRIAYIQNPRDVVIVFKLKGRPEEGKILSIDEIKKIGYEWGRLIMEGARIKSRHVRYQHTDIFFEEIIRGDKDEVYYSIEQGPFYGPYLNSEEAFNDAKLEVDAELEVLGKNPKLNIL